MREDAPLVRGHTSSRTAVPPSRDGSAARATLTRGSVSSWPRTTESGSYYTAASPSREQYGCGGGSWRGLPCMTMRRSTPTSGRHNAWGCRPRLQLKLAAAAESLRLRACVGRYRRGAARPSHVCGGASEVASAAPYRSIERPRCAVRRELRAYGPSRTCPTPRTAQAQY